jgi:hypothetical protein
MNQGFGLRNDSVRDLEGRAYGERDVLRREVNARASHPNEAKLVLKDQAESLIKPVVSPDAIIVCTISDLATCIADSMPVTCPLRVMAAMLDTRRLYPRPPYVIPAKFVLAVRLAAFATLRSIASTV